MSSTSFNGSPHVSVSEDFFGLIELSAWVQSQWDRVVNSVASRIASNVKKKVEWQNESVLYSIDHRWYLYTVTGRGYEEESLPLSNHDARPVAVGSFPYACGHAGRNSHVREDRAVGPWRMGIPRRRLKSPLYEDICNTPSIESVLEINEWYCSSKNSCGIKTRKNTGRYDIKKLLKTQWEKRRKI